MQLFTFFMFAEALLWDTTFLTIFGYWGGWGISELWMMEVAGTEKVWWEDGVGNDLMIYSHIFCWLTVVLQYLFNISVWTTSTYGLNEELPNHLLLESLLKYREPVRATASLLLTLPLVVCCRNLGDNAIRSIQADAFAKMKSLRQL